MGLGRGCCGFGRAFRPTMAPAAAGRLHKGKRGGQSQLLALLLRFARAWMRC